MTPVTPNQTSSQYETTQSEEKIDSLVEEVKPETELDLEFLYTRDIEFRQETIYFIVVDRFHDGDPANNEGPNPELYDPEGKDWGKYWGGDLQGVIDKLDYLKDMGVTAVWLTPLFEQVEALFVEQAAIHGYWTKDFKRLNPRFIAKGDNPSVNQTQETKDTVFDKLVYELHQRKMKLVLDIVCNHSNPDFSGKKGELYDDGVKIADFNDDKDNWYHHYGEVQNWEDEWQVQNCELSGLATFNENNIAYRSYIKSAIKQWLDRGVDALRVDTVKHMPIWFWQEFTADILTHRPDVFIFGEWIYSDPRNDLSVEFVNESGMTILDFGLCVAIREVLGQGAEAGFQLIQDVLNLDHRYYGATELITFIDNHDMPRFQSLNADRQMLRLAINLIMTSRGIPCLYYGTEQYLHDDTEGGNDPYNRPMMEKWDTDSPIYRDVRLLSGLRRLNPAISMGSQWQKYLTADVYCYVRRYRDSVVFVAMNRGDSVTVEAVDTELPDGEHTEVLSRRKFEVKDGMLYNLELGDREVMIFSRVGERVKGKTIVRAQLNSVKSQPGERIVVVGDCPELGNWDISKAYPLEYINTNTWFGEIPFNESAGKLISYKYALLREGRSPLRENLVCRRWVLASEGTVKWRDKWVSGRES
ncbi:MAG: alpha amylase C-terminal domain-containing protein [Microcoleus sp. PH2017_25_DOB_D_A]|jgi:cyclomaltodextrin glucanotransferase|uniref:alpha-amylase family glycosyl hydrolase n=1 Tax=unclassified Microcoleus TaxID=2642155 RepID=UPI001D222505|nr:MULTISPECIES: alpha-amylase family glycosyl hydrolase [unclassified Microcoleus]MCC3465610.1 alpha amylase C-terminal domain-containing protein [Microcoleus sp. PH2017_06_SFM_O_A]TAE44230.1 MAG: cyclomaltodextrin glucanotransferase [Oscillatoriales cyanobacterium]MCC3535279.1 alpha amylase C-terminal domain-containing protein [Microcoleus sp. PH2017_25_DOB_D_A]MCC3546249.1 alpha amylase C-terminal domain-containing protein [Microcoleus sp. PH2017_24_DOB_U_A]MCC3583335.1 alpha amylase C-term